MNGFYLEVAAVVPVLSGASRVELEELGSALANEIQRAKDAEQANAEAINAEKERAKQAEQANRQLITDLVGESPETLDTIHEISSWIINNETGAAAMAKEINKNTNTIKTLANTSMSFENTGIGVIDGELVLTKKSVNGEHVSHDIIPSATTKSAGVMSAEDKVALDTATSRALRALFVAAGTEYNNSGTDKTKTAPWGETVIHKAGHYYLNGLGDITERQMMDIYNAPHDGRTPFAYARNNARTFIIRGGTQQAAITNLVAWFGQAYNMEALAPVDFLGAVSGSCDRMFSGCLNLRHLYLNGFSFLYASNFSNAFTGCSSLITCCIKKVAKNIAFADSSKISKESIIYIVENSAPTSAITITLHPDAYARLADDADIVAALAAQPLITLVSA